MYCIGADIGGSHITVALFEHTDKVVRIGSIVSRKVNSKASKDEILSSWADALRTVINLTRVEITGVGLAIPGPFDYYNGICKIKGVDKLDHLFDVNVRTELAERLNFSPDRIRFINDACAFAIAESSVGEASRYSRAVAITLGTGFGSSFISNGMPIITANDVPLGGFLYNQEYNGNIADELFSTRGLINSHYTNSGIVCKSVLEIGLLASHEKAARETFALFGKSLGTFLSPHLKNFNAEVLVLGGNISKSFVLFEKSLQQQLAGIQIYVSKYGEEAAMIGGAKLLDDKYYYNLQETLKIM